MSTDNDLLKQLFENLPQEARLQFLRRVMDSLDDPQRNALLAEYGQETTTAKAPEKATPEALEAPRIFVHPTPEPAKKPSTPEEKEAVIQAAIQRASFEAPQTTKGDMRKQLWSCIGILALVGLGIVLLGFGSGQIFYWLKEVFN